MHYIYKKDSLAAACLSEGSLVSSNPSSPAPRTLTPSPFLAFPTLPSLYLHHLPTMPPPHPTSFG